MEFINSEHIVYWKYFRGRIKGKYVKASAQAKILEKIEKNLTEEEKKVVKRGRNTKTHSAPKNADLTDYMYATAFEALIGYLYVTEQQERLLQILEMCVKK